MRSGFWILGLVAASSCATAAWACRCVPLTSATAYRAAEAIAVVTVVGTRDINPYNRVYDVEVKRGWKHPLSPRQAITTRRTTCMADLTQGHSYLVYLDIRPGALPETSRCSGNLPTEQAGKAIDWLSRNGRIASGAAGR